MKDLDQIGVMAKAEMGFIKMIVTPLWSLINLFLNNELESCILNLNMNAQKWEKIYLENSNDTEKKAFINTIQYPVEEEQHSAGFTSKRSKSLFSNLKKSLINTPPNRVGSENN